MSAIDAFKAPSLVSKKTRKEMVQDKDDVVIDSSTLSTQSMQEDVDMDESSSSSGISKPKFAAVSGGEANVRESTTLKQDLVLTLLLFFPI